ncbi:MAG TPA: BON domain-containing protein [Chitinophagaceae bacterium]|nr:BON domain-containing protein [Chitinophagaceae bacterium]
MEDQTHTPVNEADELIRKTILDRLKEEPKLDESGMIVEVHNSVVVLKGKADTEDEKQLVEKIAGAVPGVTKVENHLHIGLALAHALTVIATRMSEVTEETEKEKKKHDEETGEHHDK